MAFFRSARHKQLGELFSLFTGFFINRADI